MKTKVTFIAIMALIVTTLVIVGCSELFKHDSSPTSPAAQQQNQAIGIEDNYTFETAGSADNFDDINPTDPFVLVEYYGQQHDDMVQYILNQCKTVAEIEAIAVEFPSIYFGQDLPDHIGWPFDSTAIMNLTFADLEYWTNSLVDSNLFSQTFANDLLATMNQLSLALDQAVDQNDFSYPDQIVKNFVARCPEYSPYLELGMIGVLEHSYNHAKEEELFYRTPPGYDDLWPILGDVVGYVGGVGITKTSVDGTAGAAVASALVELVEDLLD